MLVEGEGAPQYVDGRGGGAPIYWWIGKGRPNMLVGGEGVP